MGGILALTIREPNGRVHRTSSSTGSLSWLVNNIRLVSKDEAHLREYLNEWYNDRKEYQQKGETLVTAERGEDHPLLAPVGYGLVVVDLTQNQIMDYQNYTRIGHFKAINIIECTNDIGYDPENVDHRRATFEATYTTGEPADELASVRFREFLEAGRIRQAYEPDGTVIPIAGSALEEADTQLYQASHLARIELDMSPFTVSTYVSHDKAEAIRLKERILSLGFELSAIEEKAWENWIAKKGYRTT